MDSCAVLWLSNVLKKTLIFCVGHWSKMINKNELKYFVYIIVTMDTLFLFLMLESYRLFYLLALVGKT